MIRTVPSSAWTRRRNSFIKETRVPVPAKAGRPARHDYEYERNGTANLFMLFAPLEGWRHVEVTDRHTALDFAQVLKTLSDRHFPGASKIVLVQDEISARTSRRHSMKPSRPPRHAVSSSGSNGTTHPSTAVGWISA